MSGYKAHKQLKQSFFMTSNIEHLNDNSEKSSFCIVVKLTIYAKPLANTPHGTHTSVEETSN